MAAHDIFEHRHSPRPNACPGCGAGNFAIVLAGECVDSYDAEHHALTLRYLHGKIAEVMTLAEIGALLRPITA